MLSQINLHSHTLQPGVHLQARVPQAQHPQHALLEPWLLPEMLSMRLCAVHLILLVSLKYTL